VSNWFYDLIGTDPEKLNALKQQLQDPQAEERKARQQLAGQFAKTKFPQLANLDDAEAARQYIEGAVPEGERAAAAENAGLEHGGLLHAAVRGFKDAWDPSFTASPTPVGESTGYAPWAHTAGNLVGYGTQFAILPKAATSLVGAGIKYAPRLEPLLSKAPRAIAAALDLGARAELGAASGHRGIAETAAETGRPIDPTADAISTVGGAMLQAMPLGYGGGTGLLGRGRSALMNALVGEAGLSSMGAANEIQAGGSGLEGVTKTLSNPKMQIIPALGAIAGAAVKPEPFHFSRASLTPEQLAVINAPRAGAALTPEQQAANDTARMMREQNARDLIAGKKLPSQSTAVTGASGPTGVPPTPHPAAVPSAQAVKGSVQGSTSVLGGVPAPAPAATPKPPFSFDPYQFDPNPALEGAMPGPLLEKGAAADLAYQLSAQQQMRELAVQAQNILRNMPGSKAYLAGAQLTSEVPHTMGGGTADVIAHMGDDVQLGHGGPVVNRKLLWKQQEQKITMPDQVVHRIPKGFAPLFGERVINANVDPKYHGNLSPNLQLYAESMDGPQHYLAYDPVKKSWHYLPDYVFPEHKVTEEARVASEKLKIKNDPAERNKTLAGTLDTERANIPEALDVDRWKELSDQMVAAIVAAARGKQ